MTRSIINPVGLHTPTGYGYSHIVSAPGEQVFIAGQYGSDDSGHVVSEDFADQVAQAFANLRTALAAVGLGPADVVCIGTYIVGHDERKLAVLLKELDATWGTELPAQTLIGVAALALPGMLFEVDAVAVRPV
ncbi:RidA family protein [Streptomyces sp. NBC_00047]|uniref:RidA family protein n=1 Tax=Streptomyces sp. NBC_00047 TaxID=2975627 RepID=UPI00224D91E7|nr:RidA family protein [Streptomyces sp. NBC_00047]MCX5606963.1 RidA family protein [Streptomyces sp. NBC_00047]